MPEGKKPLGEQVTYEKANTPDVPPSEAIERAWASNDKIQYDNAINQSNMTNSNALTFREKLEHEYLLDKTQEREHKEQLFKQVLENNRYTLNSLYGFSPEEASYFIPMLEEILKVLKTKAAETTSTA